MLNTFFQGGQKYCRGGLAPLVTGLEVNNETFFTPLRSYYEIDYIACYTQYIYILFLVKDSDTTQNFNIHKCLHL